MDVQSFTAWTGLDPEAFVARRRGHAERFLATRSLTMDRLATAVAEQSDESPRHILLTSSAVHGLANDLSDIDLIAVAPSAGVADGMATQLFIDDNHLEVIALPQPDVAQSLAALDALSADVPHAVAAGLAAWNKRQLVSRKYLERLVNGLDLTGSMPYLDWLPALGRAWTCESSVNAAMGAVLCGLAEAAGEQRGRLGYAVNSLLHAMDAVLSSHGDVYSNKKWYLLRWQRFVDGGFAHDSTADAVGAVESFRGRLSAALADPAAAPPLGPALMSLVAETATVLDVALADKWVLAPVDGVVSVPFLPGASMRVGGGDALLLPDAGGPEAVVALDGLVGFDRADAAAWLRALRGGMAQLTARAS